MDLIIERLSDVVNLRHPHDNTILAQQIRKNGHYVWRSNDPDIQEMCDEWADGSTIGGMASIIADALKC